MFRRYKENMTEDTLTNNDKCIINQCLSNKYIFTNSNSIPVQKVYVNSKE